MYGKNIAYKKHNTVEEFIIEEILRKPLICLSSMGDLQGESLLHGM